MIESKKIKKIIKRNPNNIFIHVKETNIFTNNSNIIEIGLDDLCKIRKELFYEYEFISLKESQLIEFIYHWEWENIDLIVDEKIKMKFIKNELAESLTESIEISRLVIFSIDGLCFRPDIETCFIDDYEFELEEFYRDNGIKLAKDIVEIDLNTKAE